VVAEKINFSSTPLLSVKNYSIFILFRQGGPDSVTVLCLCIGPESEASDLKGHFSAPPNKSKELFMSEFNLRGRMPLLAAAAIAAVCASASAEPAGTPGSGTLTDKRDGRAYATMKIGAKTWMTENINIEAGASWCYDGDSSNCNAYGRLYDWETAKTACPPGWRLPTLKEWGIFVKAVSDKEAAEKKARAAKGADDGGGATDERRLPTILGGGRYRIGGEYSRIGGYSYWWAATEKSNQYASYYRYVNYGNENIADDFDIREYGFSVRCLRD